MLVRTMRKLSFFTVGILLLCASFALSFIQTSHGLLASSVASLHSKSLMSRSTRSIILNAADGGEDEEELEFMYETGFTKRKKSGSWKKTDNRDSLPFVVSSKSVDGKPSEIGTYLLDSSTGCGDLLDLSGSMFMVHRVSYLYKYEQGGFRVFKKKLDVTSTKASWSDTATEDNQRFLQ